MIPAFFEHITEYGSLSVVGLAKNVGKTVCLRALLDFYGKNGQGAKLAVTSIGTDGEAIDQVYQTDKPELTFYPGMLVQTAEQYYHRRRLTAEIVDISRESTACGRLVSARVVSPGKMIISGHAYTKGLQEYIRLSHTYGAQTAIIDGALSRLSLASPFVSEAMVLCTGAAVSKNAEELIKKTVFQFNLLHLPLFSSLPIGQKTTSFLQETTSGVHGIDKQGQIADLQIPSLLRLDGQMEKIEPYCESGSFLYIAGLLNDSFLNRLAARSRRPDLVVSDFTKLFFSEPVYRAFTRTGSRIWVLRQPKIVGLCINPVSPDGYRFNSEAIRSKLQEALEFPVYDVLGG